jgi:hypothetical protein
MAATASVPLPTASAFTAASARSETTPSTSRGWELATRTRSPARPGGISGAAGTSARANGMVNQKQLPFPGVLSTPMRPPMRATSWRQMASPSPVPPNSRVVDRSACSNGSKRRAWSR